MAIGVPYDLFWVLNPRELEPFKKAFSLSQEISDINNWQLGNYIRVAVASVLDPKAKFPDKPFVYGQKSKSELSEDEKLRVGRENNQLVAQLLMNRIAKREGKSSGGD